MSENTVTVYMYVFKCTKRHSARARSLPLANNGYIRLVFEVFLCTMQKTRDEYPEDVAACRGHSALKGVLASYRQVSLHSCFLRQIISSVISMACHYISLAPSFMFSHAASFA